MPYTLAAAATATGVTQETILAAIHDGRLSAAQDERGEWHIEAGALHALFPPVTAAHATSAVAGTYSAPEVEALTAQIEALLRKVADRLRRQLDQARGTTNEQDRSRIAELLLAGREDKLP